MKILKHLLNATAWYSKCGPRAASTNVPESLLQMHNGRPHARSTESKSAFLIKAPGVWLAHENLRCPQLQYLLDNFFNDHEIMPS